eukprot:3569757-Rhodomonas_salina.1
MPGTDKAIQISASTYVRVRVLTSCMILPDGFSHQRGFAGVRRAGMQLLHLNLPYIRHACYVMSGTDSAYGATQLVTSVRDEVSAYARATRCPVLTRCMLQWTERALCVPPRRTRGTTHSMVLRIRYALSGTDQAYAATR